MKTSREYFETNDTFVRTTVQKYMVPSVIALMGTTLTVVANSMIAGRCIGAEALAALNLVNPVYFAFAALGALINVGASTKASVCIGKNDADGAGVYAALALWLTLLLSVVITAGGLMLFPQLVETLGAAQSMEPYVRHYGKVLITGGAAIAFMYYPFNFLKVDGRPKQGTYMFLVMFVLDLIFCALFLGKLHMGIKGLALAFVISTFLGDLYGMMILIGGGFRLSFGKVWNIGKRTAETVKTGSSIALNNLCNIFRTAAMNYIILHVLSEEGLTVFAVIGSISNFSGAVISGIAQTITPLIGVFYGEGDNISIKTVVREATQKGTKGILLLTASVCVFSKWAGSAFGVAEVLSLIPALILFAASFLPGMLNHIYIFHYFTTGRTGRANLMTFLRGFAIPVLSALCFIRFEWTGLVWFSFAAAEFVTLFVIWVSSRLCCRFNKDLEGMLLLDRRYEEEDRYLAFSVENTVQEATDAAAKIAVFCEEKKMPSKTTMAISLAVEEMLVIIFEHCLADKEAQYADVRIMWMEKKIILCMRCAGRLFDPIAYYTARKKACKSGELLLDDSLGIEMIVKQAEDVIFNRTFGMNNLTIVLRPV